MHVPLTAKDSRGYQGRFLSGQFPSFGSLIANSVAPVFLDPKFSEAAVLRGSSSLSPENTSRQRAGQAQDWSLSQMKSPVMPADQYLQTVALSISYSFLFMTRG